MRLQRVRRVIKRVGETCTIIACFAPVIVYVYSYVLIDCIDRIKEIMNSHDDLIKQVVKGDSFKLLNSIDEMVKSDSPMEVYKKYEPLYLKMSNPRQEEKVITNKFF